MSEDISVFKSIDTPLSCYQHALDQNQLAYHPMQEALMFALQALYERLKKGFSRRRFAALRQRNVLVKGLYIWGPVGGGKTCLMDLFFEALPGDRCQRFHFHYFMRWVHERLNAHEGEPDPLARVARELAHQGRIICLDEFWVDDIADAMILQELLKALLTERVNLVVTSNVEPQKLYEKGLQRERFLPAIDLLLEHLDVFALTHGKDYRVSGTETPMSVSPETEKEITPPVAKKDTASTEHSSKPLTETYYFYPEAMKEVTQFFEVFHAKAQGEVTRGGEIVLSKRPCPVILKASDAVCFEFDVICAAPRHVNDYIQLVGQYHLVALKGVQPIKPQQHDKVRYFMHLIDVLFESGAECVILASCPIEEIYPEGLLAEPFKRTVSRLRAMSDPHDS